MPTSLPRVNLPANVWVDLYAATGITAGIKLRVQNAGSSEVLLVESATKPITSSTGSNPLPTREFYTNKSGNVGAWAYTSDGGSLQVEED